MADEKIVIAKHPPNDGRNYEAQCARCGSHLDYLELEGDGVSEECSSTPGYCTANPLPGRENVPRGSIEWFAWGEE